LIEATLALSVVTIGLLGIITLLSKAFFYHRVVSDQLTATYLASEGVEVAKNLIDHDVYSGAAWGACFAPYESAGGVANLALDYGTTDCGTLQSYSAGLFLRFDPTTNMYSYRATAGSAVTNFSRDVRVQANGAELTVHSIVTWSTGPITSESVDLEDHFYDWR
jgi:hypothetical protein